MKVKTECKDKKTGDGMQNNMHNIRRSLSMLIVACDVGRGLSMLVVACHHLLFCCMDASLFLHFLALPSLHPSF